MNSLSYEVTAGSIVGKHHVFNKNLLVGKPNQDGHAWMKHDDLLIAVVTDGCGSGSHSEVGARLAARYLLTTIEHIYRRMQRSMEQEHVPIASTSFWERVRQDLLAYIHMLTEKLTPEEIPYAATLRDYFLFTVVAAVVTPDDTVIASIGDGVFSVNGEVHRLGPFEHNKPPYPAYALVGSEFSNKPELLRFTVHPVVPTAQLQSLLIGSDGVNDLIAAETLCLPGKQEPVGPFSQWWSDDRYFLNTDSVRRRLALMNSQRTQWSAARQCFETIPGLLPDDTTLIAVRHVPKKGGGS